MDHLQSHSTQFDTALFACHTYSDIDVATSLLDAQIKPVAIPTRFKTSAVAQRLAHTAESHSSQLYFSIAMTLALIVIATSSRLMSPLAGLWFLVGASLAYANATLIVRRAKRSWQRAFLAATEASSLCWSSGSRYSSR